LSIEIIESGITLFIAGIILGGTVSIFIVKLFINKRLKKYFKMFNELSLHNIRSKREKEQKLKELKKIVKILNISQENSGKVKNQNPANYETFDLYLDHLNKILYDKGIAKIEDSFPPS